MQAVRGRLGATIDEAGSTIHRLYIATHKLLYIFRLLYFYCLLTFYRLTLSIKKPTLCISLVAERIVYLWYHVSRQFVTILTEDRKNFVAAVVFCSEIPHWSSPLFFPCLHLWLDTKLFSLAYRLYFYHLIFFKDVQSSFLQSRISDLSAEYRISVCRRKHLLKESDTMCFELVCPTPIRSAFETV